MNEWMNEWIINKYDLKRWKKSVVNKNCLVTTSKIYTFLYTLLVKSLEKLRFFFLNVFGRSLFCSPKQHLFNEKYCKNSKNCEILLQFKISVSMRISVKM